VACGYSASIGASAPVSIDLALSHTACQQECSDTDRAGLLHVRYEQNGSGRIRFLRLSAQAVSKIMVQQTVVSLDTTTTVTNSNATGIVSASVLLFALDEALERLSSRDV
jgi:hypothetical protein